MKFIETNFCSCPSMPNLKNIRLKLRKYMPTEGRTDITKLIDTFRYLFEKCLNSTQISKSHSVYSICNQNPQWVKCCYYRGFTTTLRHTTVGRTTQD